MKRFYIAVVLILMMILKGYEASFSQEDAKYVSSMTWSSDSKLIALGFEDGDIQIIDSETNEIMHQFNVEDRKIQWLDWHPKESLLAIGSQNGIVYIRDADSHTYLHEITELPFFSISRVYWNPSGDYLFITQIDGSPNLNVWSLEQGELIASIDVRNVIDIRWNENNGLIAIGHTIPHIELFNSVNFAYEDYVGFTIEELQELGRKNISNAVFALDWNISGEYIVTGSIDGFVTLWDVTNRVSIHQWKDISNENRGIYCVWFSSTDSTYNSVSANGIYRSWDTLTGELIFDVQIASFTYLATISPDKTKLAYIDEQNELHIIEINDLITAQIRLKIDECVATDDGLHTQLNDFLDNDSVGFINQLATADLNTISGECADTLIEMANLLLEAE